MHNGTLRRLNVKNTILLFVEKVTNFTPLQNV